MPRSPGERPARSAPGTARSAGSSSNAVIENERRPAFRARMRAANAVNSVPAPAPGSNTLTDWPFVSHIAAISRATHIGVKYWPRAIWRSASRLALAALRITAPSARRRSAISGGSWGIGSREGVACRAGMLPLMAAPEVTVRTPGSGVRAASVNGVWLPSGMGAAPDGGDSPEAKGRFGGGPRLGRTEADRSGRSEISQTLSAESHRGRRGVCSGLLFANQPRKQYSECQLRFT